MKFERKTIGLVLCMTIGVSLFVGLASAAPKPDPLTQILQILQAMKPEVDNVNYHAENNTQILYFHSEYQYMVTSSGGNRPPNTHIHTNKPVLFTVSVEIRVYPEDAYVWVTTDDPRTVTMDGLTQMLVNPTIDDKYFDTATFAGEGMDILAYIMPGSLDMNFGYSLMIQGAPDTVITFVQ